MNAGALKRLWAWPTALGAAIGFGLVCALVADGSWDVAGALCLAAPAAFCLWLTARRSRSGSTNGEWKDTADSTRTDGRLRDG